jgi:two-component system response regulator PilR (NtrC family)
MNTLMTAVTTGNTGNTGKIIIVEDEQLIAEMLKDVLVHAGFDPANIDLAKTVAEGQECLRREKYSVVICDMQLPDGLGLEVIEDLRGTETKVLMMTGNDNLAPVVQRLDIGGFLKKPFLMENFREMVRKLSLAVA